jgi:hypothetical protein
MSPDEHREPVPEVVGADRIAQRMQDRLARETVLERTVGDDRLHHTSSKLPCQ